jgi:hypothetical protein
MTAKKNRIRQDIHGAWYCTECGKAGFKNKQSGNSHLSSCAGISGLMTAMVAPDHHQVTTTTIPESLRLSEPFQMAVKAMTAVPLVANDNSMAMLRVQNAQLVNRLENVEKLAGNHIGHLTGAMSGVQNFFESPSFKWILLGLGLVALVYLFENGDSKTKQSVGTKLLDLAIKKI